MTSVQAAAAPSVVTRHTTDLEWRARNPLRAWRVQTGTRATVVARRVGVTKQTVMYWERGRMAPRPQAMAHLARATGIADIGVRWVAWLEEAP